MIRRICLAVALLSSLAFPAQAGDVQLLGSGSLTKIASSRTGKPFLLVYWSLSCAHCPKELRALGELTQRYPGLDVVLVSTDTPADAADAAQLAREYGLGASEQWIFADAVPARLRAEIDPSWHGELPRTVFYDATHQKTSRSGVVPPRRLEAWAREHAR